MHNFFHSDSGVSSEHPTREMLLLLVDGELPTKEAEQLDAHLEACWPCRAKTQKIQRAIGDIIEFDDRVLIPSLVPPKGWHSFDRRLSELAAASGKQSLGSRLIGSLGRFVPFRYRLGFPRLLSPTPIRNVINVFLGVAILALAIRFSYEPTVSASQFIERSIEAEVLQVGSTSNPVHHQKLRITRKEARGGHALEIDIWRDANNTRVRQFIADSKKVVQIAHDTSKEIKPDVDDQDLMMDLKSVLEANHMDPTRPLSATSYKSWHNTLRGQRDEIIKLKDQSGLNVVSLNTVLSSPVTHGQISEATLTVRAENWLPIELRFTVNADGGSRVYEVIQTVSEVLSLDKVDSTIFRDERIPDLSDNKKFHNRKAELPHSAALRTDPGYLPNTTELEVEALRLLHEAGADLGEQITVRRSAGGQLEIVGVVESEKRKREIIDAFALLAGNPDVQIEIRTVAEAVADQQKKIRPRVSGAVAEEQIQIMSESIAAAPELREMFNRDDQMRDFAARVVGRSRNAMSHIYAIKRLLAQFDSESLAKLTPLSKEKWLELVRAHARAYQSEISLLRRELRPVFAASAASASPANIPAITGDFSLRAKVGELFSAASALDDALHSAFSVSRETPRVLAMRSPQFWREWNTTEGLAAAIVQAR